MEEAQQTSYYCGPASTRIDLNSTFGTSPTQAELAREEGTSSDNGTGFEAILTVLNHQAQASVGQAFYIRDTPGQPVDLLSDVVEASTGGDPTGGSAGSTVLLNVISAPLDYWGTTVTYGHYNIAYGYDYSNGGVIDIFDEYNPALFYSNYPYTNPYGQHAVPLDLTTAMGKHLGAYWAVRGSNSQSLIW